MPLDTLGQRTLKSSWIMRRGTVGYQFATTAQESNHTSCNQVAMDIGACRECGSALKESGGRLRVWSREAGGTEVELSVPSHLAFEYQASHRPRSLS